MILLILNDRYRFTRISQYDIVEDIDATCAFVESLFIEISFVDDNAVCKIVSKSGG